MSAVVQSRCTVTKDTLQALKTETKRLLRQGWVCDGRVRQSMAGTRWELLRRDYTDEAEDQYRQVTVPQYTQRFVRYR